MTERGCRNLQVGVGESLTRLPEESTNVTKYLGDAYIEGQHREGGQNTFVDVLEVAHFRLGTVGTLKQFANGYCTGELLLTRNG